MSKYLVRVYIGDNYYNYHKDCYEISIGGEDHLCFDGIFEIYLDDVSSVFEHINQFNKVLIEEV